MLGQMPPQMPTQGTIVPRPSKAPKVAMTPQLLTSIKNSKKGKIPAGLLKWQQSHKKAAKKGK